MQRQAFFKALDKAKLTLSQLDYIFAGDLLNQCTASTFALRDTGLPYYGLFGACSTMAEGLGLAAMMIDGGYADFTCALTSSHFCSDGGHHRMHPGCRDHGRRQHGGGHGPGSL